LNRIIFKILFLLITSAVSVYSQVTVEQEISTDSVDVFFHNENEGKLKSANLAMATSVLLPGLGYQKFERPNKALAFFTTDLLMLVGAAFCWKYSDRLWRDAQGYAGLYAGVTYSDRKDEKYWQTVGQFEDLAAYNDIMGLNRTQEDQYGVEKNWYWIDPYYRDEYNKIRNRSRTYHIASTCFIGAMVLERVIAFVDIRTTARNSTHGFATSISLHPVIDNGPGIRLTADF
jgi:hypothetical protein